MILRKDDAFTLTEVLVAIVILMVGMLGLLQSVNVAMEHNLRNHLRDEAVYVGEKYLNQIKGQGFDNVLTAFPLMSTASKVRGPGRKLYVEASSACLPSDVTCDVKQLLVVVKWNYKGIGYENRVTVPVAKPQ